jgi:hypothetical protein
MPQGNYPQSLQELFRLSHGGALMEAKRKANTSVVRRLSQNQPKIAEGHLRYGICAVPLKELFGLEPVQRQRIRDWEPVELTESIIPYRNTVQSRPPGIGRSSPGG